MAQNKLLSILSRIDLFISTNIFVCSLSNREASIWPILPSCGAAVTTPLPLIPLAKFLVDYGALISSILEFTKQGSSYLPLIDWNDGLLAFFFYD